jgi:hypothetical protein
VIARVTRGSDRDERECGEKKKLVDKSRHHFAFLYLIEPRLIDCNSLHQFGFHA